MVDQVVASDEDAYALIERALDGQLPDDVSLNFADWPQLRIRLTGQKFQQSLTPTVMQGLVDLQASIYRSYAVARYNVPDSRKLSKEEREQLEFVVKVEDGSADLGIDLQKLLEHFCDQVAGRMSPTEIVVLLLGAGLLWAGKTVFRDYLTHRRKIRVGELNSEERIAHLQHVEKLSEQETARTQILAKAIQNNPKLDNIERQSYDAKTDLLKKLSEADTIQIGDMQGFDGEIAHELTRNARRKAKEIRLDGIYRITRVDSSNPMVFRVRVRDVNDANQSFDANVQDEFINPVNKGILQNAEWERRQVYLKINAKIFDDEIRDAVIIGVDLSDA